MEPDVFLRDIARSRRKHKTKPTTITLRGIRRKELARGRLLYPDVEGVERPRTRGDCRGHEGPCPFVSCRHHLYLDVTNAGGIKLNFPDLEPEEMAESCSLDVAERGVHTMERVGELLNVVRERVRQMEDAALEKVRARYVREDDAAVADAAARVPAAVVLPAVEGAAHRKVR